MGTFALNAGIAGASDVTGLDISEYAVQQANDNAVRNHLEDTVHFPTYQVPVSYTHLDVYKRQPFPSPLGILAVLHPPILKDYNSPSSPIHAYLLPAQYTD